MHGQNNVSSMVKRAEKNATRQIKHGMCSISIQHFNTHSRSLGNHMVNLLRPGVSTLTKALDKLELGGIDIRALLKGEGLVTARFQSKAFSHKTDGLVTAEGFLLGNGAIDGAHIVNAVGNRSLGSILELANGNDGEGFALHLEGVDDVLSSVGGDGGGVGEEDADILHVGGTDEVTNLLHGLEVITDRGHPVLHAGQLQLGREGTGLGGLEELELVEEAGVASVTAEEALLGELLVVDEGDDGIEVEGSLLVVEHVEDELVGALLGADVSRNQNAAVEVVAGGDGLRGLEVGLDLLGGIGLLLGLSAVRRAVDAPRRDEELGR